MRWLTRCSNCTVPAHLSRSPTTTGEHTQEAEIQASGIPPTNDLESAIMATLAPGAYTAIVRGNNDTSGVALVEVYDLNQAVDSKLANISTRAFVSRVTTLSSRASCWRQARWQ